MFEEHCIEESDNNIKCFVNTSFDVSTLLEEKETVDTVKETKDMAVTSNPPPSDSGFVHSDSEVIERGERGEDRVEIMVEE